MDCELESKDSERPYQEQSRGSTLQSALSDLESMQVYLLAQALHNLYIQLHRVQQDLAFSHSSGDETFVLRECFDFFRSQFEYAQR